MWIVRRNVQVQRHWKIRIFIAVIASTFQSSFFHERVYDDQSRSRCSFSCILGNSTPWFSEGADPNILNKFQRTSLYSIYKQISDVRNITPGILTQIFSISTTIQQFFKHHCSGCSSSVVHQKASLTDVVGSAICTDAPCCSNSLTTRERTVGDGSQKQS